MINSVRISGFRGIREGELQGFAALNILVGVNGSGKSTVLNAVFIAADPNVGISVGLVAERHRDELGGSSWLRSNYAPRPQSVNIHVTTRGGHERTVELWDDRVPMPQEMIVYKVHNTPGSRAPDFSGQVVFKPGERFHINAAGASGLTDVSEARMVELSRSDQRRTLHDLYSDNVKKGRRGKVLSMLKALVPGIVGLEILTDENQPVLHLLYEDRSIPAVLAGDGIRSILRLALELVPAEGGTVLIEEPEVHQHPAALRQCARLLWAAVRQKVQVILTTHSLDLIDSILAEAGAEDIDSLALYRMRLAEGILLSTRVEGKEIAFARGEIQDDLR